MKSLYKAVMSLTNGYEYESPTLKSLQKVREWITLETFNEKKYEYLGHIEIHTITYNSNDLVVSKSTKYYYEW